MNCRILGCTITLVSLFIVGSTPAADNQLDAAQKEAGWFLLFNGTSLDGWKADTWNPGGFSVTDGEVTHHAEVSSEPNRVGTSQVRTVTWQDGDLTLTTPPIGVGDSASAFALTWRRVKE